MADKYLENMQAFSNKLIPEKEYWLEKLSGVTEVTGFPVDFNPRARANAGQTGKAALDFFLSETTAQRLLAICNQSPAGAFLLLLSGVNYLLYRYTGNEDLIVGMPVLKQNNTALPSVNNLVVLRSRVSGRYSFKELLDEIKQTVNEAVKHQNFPFGKIVELLNWENAPISGEISRFILPALVTLENLHDSKAIAENTATQAAMAFNFTIKESTISCRLEYDGDLYTLPAIRRIQAHLTNFFETVVKNPKISLKQIEVLTGEEKKQILGDFNNTAVNYFAEKTQVCLLHKLFERQAVKNPDNIALISKEARVTYRELNERADKLAKYLRRKGVQSDTIVGIMAERSPEMLIGILGVLKAGGAYLPIDPAYPEERIKYILEDSGTNLLLTGQEPGTQFDFSGDILDLRNEELYRADDSLLNGANPEGLNRPEDLAYIIYTSGSTGRPKGVMIEHRSAANILLALQQKYPLTMMDAYLLKTSYTFDVSIAELFGWFHDGGRLVILEPGAEKDPGRILETIASYQVTHINFVPSMLKVFLESLSEDDLPSLSRLKYILVAGEALPKESVARFYQLAGAYGREIRFENIYGPTEGTIYTTSFALDKLPEGVNVPIGQPLPNTKVYILNQNNQLQPIGVPGELCITGVGLARGYLRRPELTAEKFVTNPFAEAEASQGTHLQRMYRTGDLGRWLPDGNIEFLGRIDHQVKIRGFRIELGEIESLLLKYKGVRDGIVAALEDREGNKYLCAYYVSETVIETAEFREYLLKVLPEYMIPAYFMRLEKLPLNPNGKIDRKALPEPNPKANSGAEYVAPTNEIEAKLAEIWEEILGLEKVGILDKFFEIGGHSLKANTLIYKIHQVFGVEMPLRDIFKTSTIQKMGKYIANAVGIGVDDYISIAPAPGREYYELSSAQKRLYILNQLEGESTRYNIPIIMELEGNVDQGRLEEVFNFLINRHEAFRTSFEIIEGEPAQRIHPAVDFKVEYSNLADGADVGATGRSPVQNHPPVQEIVSSFIRPFNLSHAPLFRVTLAELNEKRYLLMCDMHHIIADGASMGILVREMIDLYIGKPMPELRIQYKDFASWQNGLKNSEKNKREEAYWLQKFSGEIPVLNLPVDYPRPLMQSTDGDSFGFKVGTEITGGLYQILTKTRTTLYMELLAMYYILLMKYSGQEDIIVGSPSAGRLHADLENIVGMFVNTIALRNYPENWKSFTSFLDEVREDAIKVYENQNYQFEELVDKLNLKRDLSRNALFDVMFILQNGGTNGLEIAGLWGMKIKPFEIAHKTAKFDLTLTAVEADGGLNFDIEYSTKLFKRETIVRMAGHFQNIISAVVKDPLIKIGDIDIVSMEEKRQILTGFNDTKAEYQKGITVQEIFEGRVAAISDRVAVVYEDKKVKYGELNQKANKLARLLRKSGVKAGSIVGIMVERSPEMIVGILGILKAGGVYLPIDPEYPQERIRYMLDDCKTNILLTQDHLTGKLRAFAGFAGEIINLEDKEIYLGDDANPNVQNSVSDPVYIIYTSGSTGVPKGVMIEHGSVVNVLSELQKSYPLGEADSYLLKTTYNFDVSVSELFGWFFGEGRLVILGKGLEKDPKSILTVIGKQNITHINFVPSMFNVFINALDRSDIDALNKLKYIFVAGEAITRDTVERFYSLTRAVRLENLYGPTEATIYATKYSLSNLGTETNVPIGGPVANLQIYIVDGHNKLQPVGVPGELCISGAGLARGYLNRPELTAEKFVPNPFVAVDASQGTRLQKMYRTGDLARWLPDGNIEYLGRMDHQVKVRGYRIELGEIESRLLMNKAVKEAVVIARENNSGEKYLCAYIVAEREIKIADLRDDLSKTLPEYMIPAYFTQLEQLPLNPNGKLDRKALPEPEKNIATGVAYLAPANETEERLAGLWEELLGIEKIGTRDNFFALGGHSLKAATLVYKVRKEFGVETPLREVFKNPTIQALAGYILSARIRGSKNENPALLKKVSSVNQQTGARHLFLVHDGSGGVDGYAMFINLVNESFNYLGFKVEQSGNFGLGEITIADLSKLYIGKIKEIQPEGPYFIAGWSTGGSVAFEMAAQLEQSGDKIEALLLFDAISPGQDKANNRFEINIETEKSFMRQILMSQISNGGDIEKLLPGTNDIAELWATFLDFIENSGSRTELTSKFKEFIPEDIKNLIPAFEELDLKELATSLNIIRQLYNARVAYVPSARLKTTRLTYFKAAQSKHIDEYDWNQYCENPIHVYEIKGDHFSIFKLPDVAELAEIFNDVMR